MNPRTAVAAAIAAAALTVVGAGTASATHTHVKVLGNEMCVVMAEGAGEAGVDLPGVVFTNNPNVDIAPSDGRNHPLHVLVHQGRAGENNDLYVAGTLAAETACAAGYVNR